MPSVPEVGANPPFRIGFWCAYGDTILPENGIGVFTYELIEAILASHPEITVAVAVRAGDAPKLAALAERHSGRLDILANRHPEAVRADSIARWERSRAARIARAAAPVDRRFTAVREWMRRGCARPRSLGRLITRMATLPPWLVLECFVLLLWPLRKGYRFLLASRASAGRVASDGLLPDDLELKVMQPQELARGAECAVWVYPFPLVLQEIRSHPSVLFIHDLVWSRFPEDFGRAAAESFAFVLRHRVAEATLFACMSEFIRKNDLIGSLDLPADRIRMIRPAAPRPPSGEPARVAPLPAPYFLYPSGIRGYKNHLGLVEALALLHARGLRYDLAFTAATAATAPADLLARIRDLRLRKHVHFLGMLGREELAARYHGAVGTVVPSLYEQGSFPVYESVLHGVPAACSDIPALREQCAGMEGAMLHFDPHSPASIAAAMASLAEDRAGHAHRQLAAAARVWTRTWDEVGRAWVAVFREAVLAFERRREAESCGPPHSD